MYDIDAKFNHWYIFLTIQHVMIAVFVRLPRIFRFAVEVILPLAVVFISHIDFYAKSTKEVLIAHQMRWFIQTSESSLSFSLQKFYFVQRGFVTNVFSFYTWSDMPDFPAPQFYGMDDFKSLSFVVRNKPLVLFPAFHSRKIYEQINRYLPAGSLTVNISYKC